MEPGKSESYTAGKVIFFEGEPADRMYVLQSGMVELRKQTEKGEIALKTVRDPNEFFGEMALIDGKPRSTSAIAVKRSELLVVDKAVFERLLQTNGAFAVRIVRVLADRIRSTNLQVTDLVDTSPAERISRGLVDYALRVGERGGGDSRYIGKEEAKNWLNVHIGVSREEVEAELDRLKELKRVAESSENPARSPVIIVTGDFIREYDRRNENR
jgi:CRP/FNR family transcriptional regulator, cyclic AMP receptor protein